MLIQLEHVTRLYKTVIGVNDISLTLENGAHGLLGPNGAGKSTLINLITGQLSPTIGSARVLGHVPRSCNALFRKLGFLPSSEGMYADVSALEWVTYLTRLQGFDGPTAKQLATRAIERVQLTEHMHRKISTFSRGMRQRTRLAQAIAHDPEFLVLDEPFSGLDPIARHSMTVLLQQWIAEGRSLLISSHVLHEIESLTRSFVLLSGGRMLASGTADDIYMLLSDVPSDLRLRVNDPRGLAADLLQQSWVSAVEVLGEEQLKVSTTGASELSRYLSQLVSEGRFWISEIRSADDSLQDIFNSLMKIHRGGL